MNITMATESAISTSIKFSSRLGWWSAWKVKEVETYFFYVSRSKIGEQSRGWVGTELESSRSTAEEIKWNGKSLGWGCLIVSFDWFCLSIFGSFGLFTRKVMPIHLEIKQLSWSRDRTSAKTRNWWYCKLFWQRAVISTGLKLNSLECPLKFIF